MAAAGRLAVTAVLGAGPIREIWQDPRVLWGSLALVAVLLVGAYVIWLVDRWRKRPATDRLDAGDQMTHFRKLYERGEISAEEFARIRARLAERLVDELDLPTATPDDPEPPPKPGTPAS